MAIANQRERPGSSSQVGAERTTTIPDSMVRLLKAVEHREHTATRHEVNWTKVQGALRHSLQESLLDYLTA